MVDSSAEHERCAGASRRLRFTAEWSKNTNDARSVVLVRRDLDSAARVSHSMVGAVAKFRAFASVSRSRRRTRPKAFVGRAGVRGSRCRVPGDFAPCGKGRRTREPHVVRTALPATASRRRWSSVSRIGRSPSCSRRTRFSSRRKSIAVCWCRLIQPASAARKTCQG